MSSETSTKRRKAGGAAHKEGTRPAASSQAAPDTGAGSMPATEAGGFQPWHLFVIATLLASSAAAVAARGTSPVNVVFVCLTVLAAGAAAYLLYRTLAPLVYSDAVDAPEMLGGRTRAALEREKTLVLRAIKELEFDRAMGKMSEADWEEMTGRLRARAVRLIRQLDSGSAAYRDLIAKELAAREASANARTATGGARETATGAAVVLALVLGGLAGASPAFAQMGGMGGTGMPDARAMSGIPRPTEDFPTGSVSVRLVRGRLTNPVADFPVEFVVDGRSQTVKSDASGRAVVSGLRPGAVVKAVATVDGERLESQEFQVPPQGGTVLLLTASDKTAQQQMARQAVSGTVVLGSQSRVVIQFDDEVVQVFYLLDLVNRGASPVKTVEPLVFVMPDEAQNTSILEGSAPATAQGRRVTVPGPFAPGTTSVQVGFQLPAGEKARVRLHLPVDFLQPAVITEKAGGTMTVNSPQLPERREANDGGKVYVLAAGPTLKAGQALEFDIAGVPHHPTWPRNVGLTLAVLLLAGGVWLAAGKGRSSGEAAARRALERRREAIFAEVLQIDRQHRAGRAEAASEARRTALVSELEKIYGELDAEAPGAGRDQGFAA